MNNNKTRDDMPDGVMQHLCRPMSSWSHDLIQGPKNLIHHLLIFSFLSCKQTDICNGTTSIQFALTVSLLWRERETCSGQNVYDLNFIYWFLNSDFLALESVVHDYWHTTISSFTTFWKVAASVVNCCGEQHLRVIYNFTTSMTVKDTT